MTPGKLLVASVSIAALVAGGGPWAARRALAQAPAAPAAPAAPVQAGLGFLQLRGTTDADAVVTAEEPAADDLPPAPEPVEDAPVRENLRQAPEGTVIAAEAAGPDADALNPPRARAADDTPFAAVGVHLGTFLLFPSFEKAVIAGGPPGTGHSLSEAMTPELVVQSDWSRHELRASVGGTYQVFFEPGIAPRFTFAADGALRLDLADGWQATFSAGYNRGGLPTTDATYPAGADTDPVVHATRAEASLARVEGPLLVRVGVSTERTQTDAITVAGVPVDLGDRNARLTAGTLRVGYELSSGLQPFVEGQVGIRHFDRAFDQAGYRQSGGFSAIRAGVAVDRGPVFTGEMAIGYRREEHEDVRLPTLEGMTFDGRATWAPTRLDTITVTAATSFTPTATTLSGGTIAFETGFVLEHAARPDMTLQADGRFRVERFDRSPRVDLAVTLGAQMTWRITRQAALVLRYSHDVVDSPEPGRATSYDTVEVRLRLQR